MVWNGNDEKDDHQHLAICFMGIYSMYWYSVTYSRKQSLRFIVERLANFNQQLPQIVTFIH